MISEKMQKLVKNNKVVKEMFEEGNRLKEIYGEENTAKCEAFYVS